MQNPLTSGNPNVAVHPAVRVPVPRSPYGREQAGPLDGAGSALVRPYWTAHERAVRRRRRRVLWLATVGLDLGTRNIHLYGSHTVRPAWTVAFEGVR